MTNPYPPLPLDITRTTPRLILRRLRESDAPDVVKAATAAGADLDDWVHHAAIYKDPDAMMGLIAESTLGVLQSSQVLLGGFCQKSGDFKLFFEIANNKNGRAGTWQLGFWVHPTARGKGYMKEALLSMTQHLFTGYLPQPQRVEFDCATENVASNKLAKACGYMAEGTTHNSYMNAHNTLQNLNLYGHTPQSWEAWKADTEAQNEANPT